MEEFGVAPGNDHAHDVGAGVPVLKSVKFTHPCWQNKVSSAVKFATGKLHEETVTVATAVPEQPLDVPVTV
mgnify:CR=1 FL=1